MIILINFLLYQIFLSKYLNLKSFFINFNHLSLHEEKGFYLKINLHFKYQTLKSEIFRLIHKFLLIKNFNKSYIYNNYKEKKNLTILFVKSF